MLCGRRERERERFFFILFCIYFITVISYLFQNIIFFWYIAHFQHHFLTATFHPYSCSGGLEGELTWPHTTLMRGVWSCSMVCWRLPVTATTPSTTPSSRSGVMTTSSSNLEVWWGWECVICVGSFTDFCPSSLLFPALLFLFYFWFCWFLYLNGVAIG